MRTQLAGFTLVLIGTTACAQDLQWAKRAGSTTTDAGNVVATDASGNVYTGGYFTGTVDFNPGAGTSNLIATNQEDAFLQKLDASGQFVYAYRFGGPAWDEVMDIHIDASGDVFVVGQFSGTVDFDPGAGVANLSATGSTNRSGFILKLNSAGVYQNAWLLKNTTASEGGFLRMHIELDPSANIIVSGTFSGSIDFNPHTVLTNTLAALFGYEDIFILKLTPTGTFTWVKRIEAPMNDDADYVNDMELDGTGNIFLLGSSDGQPDVDPGAGINLVTTGSGSFIVKLSNTGTFAWVRFIGGLTASKSMAIDGAGDLLLTGNYSGELYMDPAIGYTGPTIGSQWSTGNVYLLKLTPAGSFIFFKSFEGAAGDAFVTKLFADTANDIYLAGTFYSPVDFDPDPAATFELNSLSSNDDVFIAKLTAAGEFVFAKSFAGYQTKLAKGLIVDASGYIYLTGWFLGMVDFDPSATVSNLSSNGNADVDIYTVKLSNCDKPSAPVDASTDLTICVGQTAALAAMGVGDISWYSSAVGGTFLGSGSAFTTPALTSTTTYYAQDSTCSHSLRTPIEVSVQICTSVEEIIGNAARLSPNPTSGMLRVDVPTGPLPESIIIVDAMGREVLRAPVEASSAAIDLSALVDGPYQVIALDEAGPAHTLGRVIKN